MARATVIVEAWIVSEGWQYYRGYPVSDVDVALLLAKDLGRDGTPVKVYRRTPDGPEMIYESPNPKS